MYLSSVERLKRFEKCVKMCTKISEMSNHVQRVSNLFKRFQIMALRPGLLLVGSFVVVAG